MRSLPSCLLLLAIITILSSCHKKENEVEITSKNFEEEVALVQNLEFAFNKDVYPDSLVNSWSWDTTSYIDFTPAVKGSYKWNSSSQLIFSPASGFKPGTAYKGKLTTKILAKGNKKYLLGRNSEFSFHTAPLMVQGTHIAWMRNEDQGTVVCQMDLELNYDVNLTEAAARLSLNTAQSPISFTCVNGGNGKTISVQFTPATQQKDGELPIEIKLVKGIRVLNSDYTTDRDTTFTDAIPSRYNLTVTSLEAQHTGNEGIITVNTSQPVVENNLKSSISIEPAVPFTVALNTAGFTITSASFKAEQSYTVNISTAIEGAFGGSLKEEFSDQAIFGKLDPSISFVNTKGMYLSSQGFKNLSLSIINVPALSVTVVKVYENNLERFLQRGKEYDGEYDEETDDYNSFQYYDSENMGDTIFRKEYTTANLPRQNASQLLHLDFTDNLPDYDGTYVICVASRDHHWIQDSKILSLSDIGLIVKQEKDKTYVFANSIKSATALAGVSVSLISTTNQRYLKATTDADGVAVFDNPINKAPGFKLGMVTAKKDKDFTFLWLQQSQIETSRYDVGGRMPNAAELNAWIYAERSLYRPGETIHISAVIRHEDGSNPGEMPVKLKLNMPNGKEFASTRKILNAEGSCETAFDLPPTAMTGTYILELYTGNDLLLSSYNFSIEDFMPDRLKADIKLDKEEYKLGDSVHLTLQADNLFGTPAINRSYEAEMTINKDNFLVKALPDYNFAIRNDVQFESVLHNGSTSESGGGTESFYLKEAMKEAGVLKGNIATTVFDENGRPVHRFAHFSVYTQPYYIGIKNFDHYSTTRKPMRIGMIAVNKTGGVLPDAEAVVTVIRKEWHTVIEQNGSHYKYVSKEETHILETQRIKLSGSNSYYSFTPQLSGEYEIRVSLPGSNSFVSERFYAYGWGDTQYTSFEVNNEGNVDIRPDKDKYASGEDAHILFTTPFDGRMLVTVERNNIIEHHYIQVTNKSASLTLNTKDEYLPNVYISATLFRPMDGNSLPLTVAHGIRNITVENKDNQLPVSVSMPEKSRSRTAQTITVKTAPGAWVTIAAVDEGILQVKNYKTPDPYSYFFQKVALTTNSFDIYPLLLPEIKTTRSSTGGDGSNDDANMRVNPMFVNRVKNVSFWSGILKADGSGMVRYTINVPQFSGDIRAMAVAYKGRKMGSGEQHIKIADPVVISVSLPRFLSPKDEVIMPVTLSNTTAKDANATITLQVNGMLAVNGSATQQTRLAANKEGRVVFNIKAKDVIGAGKVTVTVRTGNEVFLNETDISIRPPASLQRKTGNGIAAENKVTDLDITSNFIPSTASGTLIVSKSPLVQFAKNMRYLVRYPYGCVEQTTSAAFPQLYYNDLVKNITGAESSDINPAYNVQQAILKLQSMQLSNGALAYWPGMDGGESWWGSIYAAHFLVEAQKAGYQVNSNTLNRLMQYMITRLKKKETEIYYYNSNESREIFAKESAYSLYVLALANQPQVSTMNYYKANPNMLATDSKYMLAAAYALSGLKQQAMQVLPKAFGAEKSNNVTGGSFYSYIRDLGVSLDALMDTDPNNPQVAVLAKMLSQEMLGSRYLNTQENVWGILALGKIARNANRTTSTATILAGGRSTGTLKGKELTLDLKNYLNQPVKVKIDGSGPQYYSWEVKGITADGSYTEEDSYIKVRKSFFDRNGRPISNNEFTPNELIVVQLRLSSQYNKKIDNIAITDMLPAGFEIENTRLIGMPELQWLKDQSEPDYIDIRDDRINLFTSIQGGKTQNFYYMVRAVSPGTYQMGPVQADAMYNGLYHSYNGAGTIKVKEH